MQQFIKHSTVLAMVVATTVFTAGAWGQGIWDAGGGIDTDWSTGANWNDGNVPGVGANVTFGTAGSEATLDSDHTVGTLTFNRSGGFAILAGGGVLTLQGGVANPVNNTPYTIWAPIHVDGFNQFSPGGSAGQLNINGNLSGGGDLRLVNTGYVTRVTFNGDNGDYGGLILIESTSGQANRFTTFQAFGPGSLGSHIALVRNSRIEYAPGATAAGGMGARALASGEIALTGTPTNADLFTVDAGGGIRGSAAQLAGLERGTNITLQGGAVVGHSSLVALGGDFGATPDLVFGVNGTFNTAAHTLTAGDGTPWAGIGTGINSTSTRLSQGTVSIDSTGMDEFVLQGFNRLGGGTVRTQTAFSLGNNTVNPVFNLSVGSPLAARIRNAVVLDFDTAGDAFAAFDSFILSDEARLTVARQNALSGGAGGSGRDMVLEGGQLLINNTTANNVLGQVTILRGANDFRPNSATTGLTVDGIDRSGQGGLLLLVDRANGGGYTLGTDEKILVSGGVAAVSTIVGHTDGGGNPMVRPYVFGVDSDRQSSVNLLTYDAIAGFKPATYHGTDLNAAGDGQIIKTAGATSLTGNRAAHSVVLSGGNLGGNFTLSLGVLDDGSRDAQGALLIESNNNSRTVSSHVDFGNAEGLVYMYGSNGNRRLTFNGGVTATDGITFYVRPVVNLESNANDISGLVSIIGPTDMQTSERPGGLLAPGILRLNGGNGFNDDVVLYLAGNVGLELGRNQTIAGLTGTGIVSDNNTYEGGVAVGHRVLTIDNSADYVFDGSLRDRFIGNASLSLVKTGPGTQMLTGDQNYSGTTDVTGGPLVFTGYLNGLGDMTAAAGGTLLIHDLGNQLGNITADVGGTVGGAGYVRLADGNSVAIANGGVVSPGASAGTWTIEGDFNFEDGAGYVWEYGPGADDFDLVDVRGTLTLGSTATITLVELGGNLPGLPILFTADSFAGATNLSAWTIIGGGGYFAMIDGNNVVLMIPEPASVALLGIAGLFALRRRRRA